MIILKLHNIGDALKTNNSIILQNIRGKLFTKINLIGVSYGIFI
jgi:hypothetical protein